MGKEEVGRGKIWQKGQVLNHLELPGPHPVRYHGGDVQQSIIPVEPQVPGRHLWLLLLENPQEASKGLRDVQGIDSFPLGMKFV